MKKPAEAGRVVGLVDSLQQFCFAAHRVELGSDRMELRVKSVQIGEGLGILIGEVEARKTEQLSGGDVDQVVSVRVRIAYHAGLTLEEVQESLVAKARETLSELMSQS